MTHPEAVNAIKQLAHRFREEGVENTLVKYARSNDLSPAQLEHLGQTYNVLSSLSTFEKSEDRGANAHQIDVPKMSSSYTSKPMRKAASADPLPSHGEHIDLFRLFRNQVKGERSLIPDEAKADREEEAADAKKSEAPNVDLLKAAAEDMDADLDVQTHFLLRGMRKTAGVYDLSSAHETACRVVDRRFVDVAVKRISAYAAGQPVAATVRKFEGELEKSACVVHDDLSRQLVKMARDVAVLHNTLVMLKEAVFGRRPGHAKIQVVLPDQQLSETGNSDEQEQEVPEPEGKMVFAGEGSPQSLFQSLSHQATLPRSLKHSFSAHPDESVELNRHRASTESTSDMPLWKLLEGLHTTAPSTPTSSASDKPKDSMDLFGGASPKETVEEVPTGNPDPDEDEDGEQGETDAPKQEKGPKSEAAPNAEAAPKFKPSQHTADGKEKTTAPKGKPGQSTDKPKDGMSATELLGKAVSVPARAGAHIQNLLSNAAASAQNHIHNLTSNPGINNAQAGVDRSVEDVRRSLLLRRTIHTDPVLSEANPHKVAKYYNELADAYPDLASNPSSLKLLLREAVAYDGLPLDTIKNLTSTRLDSARAHKEEMDLRNANYRI